MARHAQCRQSRQRPAKGPAQKLQPTRTACRVQRYRKIPWGVPHARTVTLTPFALVRPQPPCAIPPTHNHFKAHPTVPCPTTRRADGVAAVGGRRGGEGAVGGGGPSGGDAAAGPGLVAARQQRAGRGSRRVARAGGGLTVVLMAVRAGRGPKGRAFGRRTAGSQLTGRRHCAASFFLLGAWVDWWSLW